MFLHDKNILISSAKKSNSKCLALSGEGIRVGFQALVCRQQGWKGRGDELELMPSQSGRGDQAPAAGMLPVSWGGSTDFGQYVLPWCPDPPHFLWISWVWMAPAQKSDIVKLRSCV